MTTDTQQNNPATATEENTQVDDKDENQNENNPIEQMKETIEESKKLLEEIRKERIKIEKAVTESLIGGRSVMTQQKKETDEEYSKRIREGNL
jgi:hypothetical protein